MRFNDVVNEDEVYVKMNYLDIFRTFSLLL